MFSFLSLSFISSFILLKSKTLFSASDMTFHFRRIMDLRDATMNDDFLPSFIFNRFHGSSVMIIYPYLNLYPLILLSFIIKSKITLIYVSFIIKTFVTLIISFYSSKKYSQSILISYIFSIIYSISSTFLAYNFTNMDLGLSSAYTFLPLILFSFLMIIDGNTNEWILLSIGMILVAFSHILTLIIFIFFLIVCLLVNINLLNKNIIICLLKSIFLFIVISSVIWLPLMHFYLFNLKNINLPGSVQLDNINIKTFLSGLYGAKNINTISFFPLITIFISIFFYHKFDLFNKQMYLLSLITIFLILFFPWQITSYKYLSFLNQFQYTYRLLIIPQILLCFLFACIVSKYIIKHNQNILIFLIILLSVFIQNLGQYSYVHNLNNSPSINQYMIKNSNILDISKINTYKINSSNQFYKLVNGENELINDYIPSSSINVSSYVRHNVGFYNTYHQIKINNIGYNTFDFSSKENMNKLSLPIYAYNKEKIYVCLNNKLISNYANKEGLLTINNINNKLKLNNKIHIKVAPDLFKIIGNILSILGLLFLLIKLLFRIKKK